MHELQAGICFATIDELEIEYARSTVDNRRHGEELVIFTDGNPFAEDGAIAYEWDFTADQEHMKDKPIYPKGHDDSADWTGPAQKLIDKVAKDKVFKQEDIAVIKNRVNNTNK